MKILFCITDNLWEPLLVLINSIIMNNETEELEFYILHDQLHKDHADIIENFVLNNKKKINILHVDKERLFPGYEELGVRLPIEAYYRVFAIDVLKDVDKILYLDVDIICNDSLSELWNMDFEGNYIIGVERISADITYEMCKSSIDIEDPYLNSGVMLMDFKEIRKNFKLNDVQEFLRSYKEYHYNYADQAFINSYFGGKIKIVEEKFNRRCAEEPGYIAPVRTNREKGAVILHWAGGCKPWSEYNDNIYLYDLEIYNKYCQLKEIGQDFKERVLFNLKCNENKIWIILENQYRYARTGPTNQQALLDYAYQKIKYGNVFEQYLKKHNYKKIAFYGMNIITEVLLSELSNSDVEILGIVDRKLIKKQHESIKIVMPKEFRDNYMIDCDVIIVNIINEYRNIVRYLDKLDITGNIRPVSEMIFSSKS